MTTREFGRKVWKSIGPGFITGAADDDPSGIATYSQTGASFGYSQLWLVLFSYPFMTAIQEMCGRIGAVSGTGLSGVIKQNYSKKVLYIAVALLLIANTVNIGADLGAMAASVQLLVPVPFVVLLFGITAFTLLLEVFVSYPAYTRFLKYLTLSLLAYIATAFLIHPDWSHILRATLVPHIALSKDYVLNVAAFLGTTISPYLFFWQADEEVEEEVEAGKLTDMGAGTPKVTRGDIQKVKLDTMTGMFFSNVITFFIIVTVAGTLGTAGIRHIQTAADAAQALRPLAGDGAFLLFALGIVGTGLLAVPVLAGSAAYSIAEAFDWKEGLSKRLREARGFYGVIMIATMVGLAVNFSGIPSMTMLYYAAMLNGVLSPPLLILILLIGNDTQILGRYTNSKLSNTLGIAAAAIMSVVALGFLFVLFQA